MELHAFARLVVRGCQNTEISTAEIRHRKVEENYLIMLPARKEHWLNLHADITFDRPVEFGWLYGSSFKFGSSLDR
jgi:hypothetical protein